MLHVDQETIIAQCTPTGSGAIALLRVSGKQAIEIVDCISILSSKRTLAQLPTHTIHFGSVVNQAGQSIDQVLFLLMRGPKTFTGQDTVEITCHNNPFIIQNIIDCAISFGARLAQNGEFTKRAFLHNKIDLVQAEAINDLIHSQTQVALKSSLAQVQGSLSSHVQQIEKDLVRALSLSESSFEFIEEDEIEFGDQIKNIVQKKLQSIEKLQENFDQQKQIKEGIRIAIIGSVNAGKSSLFNCLLEQDRAIVTNVAGTTRDSIEASIVRNDNFITLVDTAGLRQTNNSIEKEGIQRSKQEAKKADIIILVLDGSRKILAEEKVVYQSIIEQYEHKIIFVRNKSDLKEGPKNIFDSIKVSSLNNENIHLLKQQIDQKIADLFSQVESPFLLNKRQYNLLSSLYNKLQDVLSLLRVNIDYEIVSYHLKDALSSLSEFTGKTISEQSIDLIFKEFCIGK